MGKIIRNNYLEKVKPFVGKDVIKVLSGLRRSGKSVLLSQIKDELLKKKAQTIFVNFESGNLPFDRTNKGFYIYIKSQYKNKKLHLFLDEIQEMEGWEKTINSIMVDFKTDIYITGSNSKLLSSELATYIGGRFVEFRVFPLSFSEAKEIDENLTVKEYMRRGSLPFIYSDNLAENDGAKYVSDVYNSTVLKDIIERYKIKNVEMLGRLLNYFKHNIGNSFSSASLFKYLKNEKRELSSETIYNYISYAKNSNLLDLVPRYDALGKKELSFNEKIYFSDFKMSELTEANINQLLENIIYIELLRRGFDVKIGKNKTSEIDFVATKNGEISYFQVCYLLADENVVRREFSAFDGIKDNYEKTVLSMDEFNFSQNGIKHQNIGEWLLG
jgi:predicted AAA+ superfamily ATPase